MSNAEDISYDDTTYPGMEVDAARDDLELRGYFNDLLPVCEVCDGLAEITVQQVNLPQPKSIRLVCRSCGGSGYAPAKENSPKA